MTMTIIERVLQLLEIKKLKISDLCTYLDVPNGLISNWKVRGTDPPSKYILQIAQLLDVSVEYLLTGQEKITIDITLVSNEEKELITNYRFLELEDRDLVFKLLKSISKKQK